MGMSHLTKLFQRSGIEIQTIGLPLQNNTQYNVSIDLATIVVPLMRLSRSRSEFTTRLHDFLVDNRCISMLLIRAYEVKAYLDLFAPRMKIDAKKERLRRRRSNSSVPMTEQMQLSEIRGLISNTFIVTLSKMDSSFRTRCSTVDTTLVGEGEIKCLLFRKHMSRPYLPHIIMSNDNDVLLMMLLHEPTGNTIRTAIHYRPQPPHGRMFLISHQVTINERILTYPPKTARWLLICWTICLCGTDFVVPLRAINRLRRKYLLSQCIRKFDQRTKLQKHESLNSEGVLIALNELADLCRTDDMPQDISPSRVEQVVRWCYRVYWNVLYLTDLPVDFYKPKREHFYTDRMMGVNAYVNSATITAQCLHLAFNCRRVETMTQYRALCMGDT